jgi:hypothetical protein
VFSRPAEPEVPWSSIAATPEAYFDTVTYDFRIGLRHPTKLSSSDIYILGEDLAKHSNKESSNPFTFYRNDTQPTSQPESEEGKSVLIVWKLRTEVLS